MGSGSGGCPRLPLRLGCDDRVGVSVSGAGRWCTCSAARTRRLPTTPLVLERRSKDAAEAGVQVVTVAVLGHKAQLCFMGAARRRLGAARPANWSWCSAGLDSGRQLRVDHRAVRVRPGPAPGDGRDAPQPQAARRRNKPAWCFYPMTKRRNPGQNWYELPYERAQGAHVRARGVGTQVRGTHRAAGDRIHGPRRLGVGRHAVRRGHRARSRRPSTPCDTTGRRPPTPSSARS